MRNNWFKLNVSLQNMPSPKAFLKARPQIVSYAMTNQIAFYLALLICGLLALDLFMDWGGTLFLLKKIYELMNAIIFWR